MIPPPHDQDTERLLRVAIQEHREGAMSMTDTEHELRRWQGSIDRTNHRRRTVLAVAASVAVLAAGAGAYAMVGGNDGPPPETTAAALRDLRTGETLGTTTLPGGAGSVDLLGGEIVVATGKALATLDATSGELLRQVAPDKGELGGPVAPAGDALWLSYFDGEKDLYARVDPAAGRITATADVGRSYWVASGGAGLWAVAQDNDVVRLDPVTGAELQRVSLDFRPFGLWVGERVVWAQAAAGGALVRIDGRTGAVTPGPTLGGSAPGVLVGERLWVVDPTTAELVQVDEQGEAGRTALPSVPPGAERETGFLIGADDRNVYVTSARDGDRQLVRVDVADAAVLDAVRLPRGPAPFFVDGAGDDVWLAAPGSTELLRLTLR